MVSAAELVDLEHQGWKALCDSTGADFYGEMMTDDAVMTLAHGFVLDRQQVIDSLNEAPPWNTYEISQERLISAGDTAAVLVYRGAAWRGESADPEFQAWMTSVYVKKQSRWRLASYQQTPIPPGS
ncbi:nuclear transport factor 2 family protein [Nesterenkonia salmonea]|uniref:Nuclear transport factor 2 family protein n=1 Tax=Nesterenkonia salmonea TaxID=1804987 RepID=A0A5R9BAT4_9MICC|nr:nuclear transport factor 2 family protein [Nesterenkonia salmonea]TLP97076.1 nuclear transport factor 2 family protein [Nesterenkonia salmonea]